MKLHRPLLSALALALGLSLASTAQADGVGNRRIYGDISASGETYLTWKPRVAVITSGDDAVASVDAELTSDVGDEDLILVESNAWLHGVATIAALPAADAALSVVLYDVGSTPLISFSGALGADGSVALSVDPSKVTPDIELRAVEVFTAAKGYDLGVDLLGVDTYGVAYAVVTVTEGGDEVCVAKDEKGNCLKWEISKAVSTRSELYWNDIGAVWEADTLLAHEGYFELKVKTYDAEGTKLATAKSKLGSPWLDGGDDVNAIATDEDPLTTLAFHRWPGFSASISPRVVKNTHLTVVSEGWAPGDDLPVDAEVELTNGEMVTIPVNSYQRRATKLDVVGYGFDTRVLSPKARITVKGDDAALADLTVDDLRAPACTDAACFLLLESEEGELYLSVTRYSADADTLPDAESYTIAVVDERGTDSWTVDVEYDDQVAAVFSNEVSFIGDPVGLDLSGRVKLLGEPNRKGKQEKLGAGKFYAQLSGDLTFLAADKDEVVSSGEVVVCGEALTLGDDKSGIHAPPVIVYANGSGTQYPRSQVSAVPRLF